MSISFGVTFQSLAREAVNGGEERWYRSMTEGQGLRVGEDKVVQVYL